MTIQTARRMQHVHRSFVRELLKVTASPEIISFAGGLPNPRFIPVEAVSKAIQQILATEGVKALQYCTSEGHPPLRQWIADRYRSVGLEVSPDQILITTGSQQGLDVLGKVLIDPGDRVVVEDPTYIAAIQAFGMYEPEFRSVRLNADGIDLDQLRHEMAGKPKLVYCMPNFQNPSGISYSRSTREKVAELLGGTSSILVEDDPYGLLRFRGDPLPSITKWRPENAAMLGSFSKIVAPGLRLGWLCAPLELIDKLLIAKQAADLHSENLGQWVIHRIVSAPDFEQHLQTIRDAYGHQCQVMLDAIQKYLPAEVQCTRPDGGMFLWLTLPGNLSSVHLFELAIKRKVAFVPGQAFHASGTGDNTMRLNFSNCDAARIEEGIQRLAEAMKEM